MRAHSNGAVLAATEDDLDELIGFVAGEATTNPTRADSVASTSLSTH